MPVTFSKRINRTRIFEPLFNRSRQKYKGSRSSYKENLEINSLVVDLNRLKIQFDTANNKIEENVFDLLGLQDLTQEQKLNDGEDTSITGVEVYYDKPVGSSLEELTIKNLNILSAKISRLENKLKRLENGI